MYLRLFFDKAANLHVTVSVFNFNYLDRDHQVRYFI